MSQGRERSKWGKFWSGEMFPDDRPEAPDDSLGSTVDGPGLESEGGVYCFCGCGQRLGFLDGGLNRNGRLAEDRVEKLGVAHDELTAVTKALGEHQDSQSQESQALVERIGSLMKTLEDRAHEGDVFEAIFADSIHGLPPLPDEARIIKRRWLTWRRITGKLLDAWEVESIDLKIALEDYRRTGVFTLPKDYFFRAEP